MKNFSFDLRFQLTLTVVFACSFVLIGCHKPQLSKPNRTNPNQSKPNRSVPTVQPLRPEISKATIEQADISVLFIGNSHSAPIPKILTEIFENQMPSKTFLSVGVYHGFLVDHAESPSTLELLQRGSWDCVVLQAQKYSTSGKYHYPYDAAIKLSRLATRQRSRIMMYPEWSRRDHPDEYKRIDRIHNEIAAQTGASVAPIGQTWSDVLAANPQMELYAADGNHASMAGSYLNAAIFYCLLTGEKINSLAGDDWDEKEKPSASDQALNQIKAVLSEAAWSSITEINDSNSN